MPELGYEFMPGADQKKRLNSANAGRMGPAANEALKILSLKLPEMLGGSPIAPDDLLRPQIGGVGGPGPAPLVGGARPGGGLGERNFPNTPFDPAPVDTGGPGGGLGGGTTAPPPHFEPGGGGSEVSVPGAPPPAPRPTGGGPLTPDAADVFEAFMRRLIR